MAGLGMLETFRVRTPISRRFGPNGWEILMALGCTAGFSQPPSQEHGLRAVERNRFLAAFC
jgi:hypothetical protein